MEKQPSRTCKVLSFHRWSRKSYAVYNSLGKVIRIAVLCLSCSILILPGHAQESRDSLQLGTASFERELEEVVVSAQRSPVVQSQLMRVVQVVTRKDIEQSPAQDLASLLENLRGVDMRKRGTFGMQADISIRGGSFDQTLILLNGINITDPQTGHHNLNVPVGLQSIARIEVLQGPGARIFGPNAFNGAINIITNEPGKESLSVGLSGGQYGFGTASLAGAWRTGATSHYLALQGMTSDGFTENTDFRSGNVFYRSMVPLGQSRLDAQGGYNQKAFGANSFYTPRFPEQFEQTRTVFASLQWIPGGRIPIKPSVYWRRHYDRFELFRNEAPAWYTHHNYHKSDVAGAGLSWSHTSWLGKSALGLDYRWEHIYSNVLGEALDQPKAVKGYADAQYTKAYQRSGLSLMGEQSYYHGPFSVSGGLLVYYNTDLDNGLQFFPGVDIGWQFTPDLRWYSSLNRTLRLPTFTDLFYSGPGNLGNAALKPEEAISAESGIKWNHRKVQAEVAIFHRWGSNMIDWVKSPGDDKWQSMNLTEVNIGGFEAGISMPFLQGSTPAQVSNVFSAQYSYMQASKSSGIWVSNYVLDHLRHKLDLGLTHAVSPKAGLSWKLSWQDREGGFMLYRDGVFEALQEFEPVWMVDVKAFYHLRNLQLFAEASNLLDSRVVSVANVPQPGRWMRIGLLFRHDFTK